MECDNPGAAADDGDCPMVDWELEAAEALAAMACCSVSQHHVMKAALFPQEKQVAAEWASDYTPSTITSTSRDAGKIVERNLAHSCTTTHQSNPLNMKFRRKLTEAEKEERKLRHIMANRESARQTIRRRQAMHMELTKKAADVLEENEYLKKQKELMVEDFNSLKVRNQFLKAHLAEARKAASGDMEDEPNSSEAERTRSATATTPIFQPPSLVPCFWPPFQCASHPHPMQFPMPPGDTPCLHQGHEHPTVAPMFIVPVPWLLPLLAQTTANGSNTHYCGKCSCSDTRLSDDLNMRAEAYNNPMQTMSSYSDSHRAHQPPATIVVPGLFSPVRRLENLDPPDTAGVGVVSGHETARDGLFRMDRGKPEDMVIATEARRRRRALMRLKNVSFK